jgi:hypothetical protein
MQRLEIGVFGAFAGADRDPAGLVVIRISLRKRERLAHFRTFARNFSHGGFSLR